MKRLYADIIVDISQEKLDKTFQYEIPEELQQAVRIGTRVRISFGKGNREITGYVTGISDLPKIESSRIKKILGLVDKSIPIESRMIALAGWIAENYGSTMNQALKTVMTVKEKQNKREKTYLVLKLTKEEAADFCQECERKHYTAKARLVKGLMDHSPMEKEEAVSTYKASSAVINGLREKGVLETEKERVWRAPFGEKGPVEKKELNEEQKGCLQEILKEWEKEVPRPVLIHGVTGSGKTEVYMELMDHVLQEGKQIIVLIPEIALTYQIVRRFRRRFGEGVSFMHSRLSAGERFDQCELARKGEISIIVGPRSALFTPFPDLGLIIIDEEHESSYKSEKTPCYHAREVAIRRGETEGAAVVMGSATPSMESYEKGLQGEYKLLHLEQRYGNRALPEVYTVDMKKELREGNRSMFSRLLQEKIQDRLDKKEQVILFLNRRGYSGFVSCRSCGHVMKCPHCDVSLTSHKNGKLICHYCGYSEPDVKICPSCGSPFIGGFKAGTQQIEETVHKMFPSARVLRMDADTTRKKDDYERILSSFAEQKADILCGTQMIVKGHDFPHVTLTGVLAADLSLNSEDFRAGERTFQLLTQAAGRSGRGEDPGEAVIQTYAPDHYTIVSAAKQDYPGFFQEEMVYRSLMGYPPVKAMAAVRGFCKDSELLEKGLNYCRKYIEKIYQGDGLILIGPAPESVSKVQDVYRMVLYMRHQDRTVLVKIKDCLERYIEVNKGFDPITIQYDFNL